MAIAAVLGVHLAMALLILSSQRIAPKAAETLRTRLITVAIPPPPPPPPPPTAAAARDARGAAGKKAEPTPVVAPPPRVEVPAKPPVPAAPVAGSGSSSSAGAASAGSGTGAGGSGSGRGAGGDGGGGIGSEARLLSGGLSRRDYRSLRAYASPEGRALLAIMVGADGRVASCAVRNSSGDPRLDAALCAILQPRMRFSPARDRDGQPIAVRAYYVATWDRG